MRHRQPAVAGIKPFQNAQIALPQPGSGGAERHAANMRDKGAGRRAMRKPGLAGAQAPIIFLGIALRENIGAEQAGGAQGIVAQI